MVSVFIILSQPEERREGPVLHYYFYNNKKRTLDSWSIEAFRIHFICCPISNTLITSQTRENIVRQRRIYLVNVLYCVQAKNREREKEKKKYDAIVNTNNE